MDAEQFHRIAKTVADPARLAALEMIGKRGELTCSNLCDQLTLTPATISHHVKELAAAELVHQRRDGKYLILTINLPVWRAYLKELARVIPQV